GVEVELLQGRGARLTGVEYPHSPYHLHAVALERDVVAEGLKARRALDEEGRRADASEPMGERQACDAGTGDDDSQGHAESYEGMAGRGVGAAPCRTGLRP